MTVLHIRFPDSDLEILQSTFAGQLAQNGVNNRGVGVGINTLANLPGGEGLPVSFHVRRILEAANVEEAVAYLDGAQFAQSMNYMICDRERAVTVETWQDQIEVLSTNGHVAAHSNHSLSADSPKTFEMTADSGGGSYGFTGERLKLALALLRAKAAAMDLAGFQDIFRTKPILVHPGKPTGRTLMNMVAEIPSSGSPVLHLSPDSPAHFAHARFSF